MNIYRSIPWDLQWHPNVIVWNFFLATTLWSHYGSHWTNIKCTCATYDSTFISNLLFLANCQLKLNFILPLSHENVHRIKFPFRLTQTQFLRNDRCVLFLFRLQKLSLLVYFRTWFSMTMRREPMSFLFFSHS